MTVGLTGGMGCGKSTVLEYMGSKGARTQSSDAVVHDLLANDAAVVGAVAKHFGEGILDAKGKVDRSRLGSIVFGDDAELKWLEELLHPRARERWRSFVGKTGGGLRVVEIPLLFENNLEKFFDITVCVCASLATQLERRKPHHLTEEQVRARIDRQMPLTEKIERADHVILNDGSITHLEDQIDFLLNRAAAGR